MKGQVFVGRQKELEDLEGYLEQSSAGKGQVCFVMGQAGSGKTALVRQFVQQALAIPVDIRSLAATGLPQQTRICIQ